MAASSTPHSENARYSRPFFIKTPVDPALGLPELMNTPCTGEPPCPPHFSGPRHFFHRRSSTRHTVKMPVTGGLSQARP